LLLARKARGAFFLGELSFNLCYLAIGFLLASRSGLEGLGLAYVVAYAFYLVVVLVLAHRETGFLVRRATLLLTLALLTLGGIALGGTIIGSDAGMITGLVVTFVASVASIVSLFRLRAKERQDDMDAEILI
jgi:antigen flippase